LVNNGTFWVDNGRFRLLPAHSDVHGHIQASLEVSGRSRHVIATLGNIQSSLGHIELFMDIFKLHKVH